MYCFTGIIITTLFQNKLFYIFIEHFVIFQVRVSIEARDLIAQCCNEFIHLVSSEANDICNKQTKKTIMPEHVIEGIFISACTLNNFESTNTYM